VTLGGHRASPPSPTRTNGAQNAGCEIKDIFFLSRVQVLVDKGRTDYRDVQEFYDARNTIAHGDELSEPVVILAVAQKMHDIASRFVIT
jgi:hypothetical protein